MDHKPDELNALLREIRACTHCAEDLPMGARPVLQVSGKARLVVAAQAPGRKVHETGIPFNDPSGDRLRDWMGVDRETFYDETRINIVPMGFCYPGKNPKGGDNPPRPECRRLWHDRLYRTLQAADLILVIGQYAHAWHLGRQRRKSLTETVRNFRDYAPRYLPLVHPSPRNTHWLQKNPWFEEEVIPEVRRRVHAVLNGGG